MTTRHVFDETRRSLDQERDKVTTKMETPMREGTVCVCGAVGGGYDFAARLPEAKLHGTTTALKRSHKKFASSSRKKGRRLPSPTQQFSHSQWWSNSLTHESQTRQWCEWGGRTIWQLEQIGRGGKCDGRRGARDGDLLPAGVVGERASLATG